MRGNSPDGARRLRRGGSGRRPGRASGVGLALVVASGLPVGTRAALSISSGYETFLMQIRRRIVVEADDVVDEADATAARACDSMLDGPFCRGLPELGRGGGMPRHRPFTVDSIVPQHLFGDPRVKAELSEASGGFLGDDAASDTLPTKQATETLNSFLENYYSPKETPARAVAIEGRMAFARLPPWAPPSRFPSSFSRGLPEGILATWDGAWQAVAGPKPGRSDGVTTVLRLNGAVGGLRFSRPVVIRSLLLRPPSGDSATGGRLLVRGRKAGKEIWQRAYIDLEDASAYAPAPCGLGDLVSCRYAGNGLRYLAYVVADHGTHATVRWLDEDHQHRLIRWQHITTADGGLPCWPKGSAAPKPPIPARGWRDLSRHVKAVDEISITVPVGEAGWLLGEVTVAAVRWPKSEDESKDPSQAVVQVLPGPRAVIADVSRAAVVYDADDMLNLGLHLRTPAAPPHVKLRLDAEDGGPKDTDSRMRLSSSRSVEGLRQMLRALRQEDASSPPVSPRRLLADAERLVTAMTATRKDVKRYYHFESWFTAHWDWLTPADGLNVAYEHWRHLPAAQTEARDAFFEGQQWSGFYYCTQGKTSLALEVARVTYADGETSPTVKAQLTFTTKKKNEDKSITGSYMVMGRLEPEGRVLELDPVPDSWTEQPENFVMVGLQGVVSRGQTPGSVRFAGNVPIFGCDVFQLSADKKPSGSPQTTDATKDEAIAVAESDSAPEGPASTWAHALERVGRSLDIAQMTWRGQLQDVLSEKVEPCSVGDKVSAKYKGNARFYPATIAKMNADGTILVNWVDKDAQHRQMPKKDVLKNGVPCNQGGKKGQEIEGLNIAEIVEAVRAGNSNGFVSVEVTSEGGNQMLMALQGAVARALGGHDGDNAAAANAPDP